MNKNINDCSLNIFFSNTTVDIKSHVSFGNKKVTVDKIILNLKILFKRFWRLHIIHDVRISSYNIIFKCSVCDKLKYVSDVTLVQELSYAWYDINCKRFFFNWFVFTLWVLHFTSALDFSIDILSRYLVPLFTHSHF